MGCYKAMVELDMNMLEINPLVLTADKDLVALDAKDELLMTMPYLDTQL